MPTVSLHHALYDSESLLDFGAGQMEESFKWGSNPFWHSLVVNIHHRSFST